jgi:predicted RNA-binding Zn-ribbon protein involved in translation (DUF1610 family)
MMSGIAHICPSCGWRWCVVMMLVSDGWLYNPDAEDSDPNCPECGARGDIKAGLHVV